MEPKNFDNHGVEISGFVTRAVKRKVYSGNQKMKKNNTWMNEFQEGRKKMKNAKSNRKGNQPAFWKSWESNMVQRVWGNLPLSLFRQPAINPVGQPVRSFSDQVDQGSIHSLMR
jgi:hypothetical protein